MDLFWRKGFEGTSLAALLEAMEISRQSLYNTFGNKHALFLAVLDRYGQMSALQLLPLQAKNTGLSNIQVYFERLVGGMESKPEYGACLMTVSAVEMGLQDWAVLQRVEAHNQALRDALYQALLEAKSKGEVRDDLDCDQQTDVLLALSRGIGVMARSGVSLERLKSTVKASLGLLAPAP